MSTSSRLSRRWQCPVCGLLNASLTTNCIACFTSRFPSERQHNKSGKDRKPEPPQIYMPSDPVKSSIHRPSIPSSLSTSIQPIKIRESIRTKISHLLAGFIRNHIAEYLYPSELVYLVNLYLTEETLFRSTINTCILHKGLKLCTPDNPIHGKGISILGFSINARDRNVLYEWTVNIRTFNPPDSFIGIIGNHHDSNHAAFDTFDYAENAFCCGIGGERHRCFKMGQLDRKTKYKSGWHCNNVSHWNDRMDVVQCRYDGRHRQLSFTKFIRNTNKVKSICTIKLPTSLPAQLMSWYPAIYLGHISDNATVHY